MRLATPRTLVKRLVVFLPVLASLQVIARGPQWATWETRPKDGYTALGRCDLAAGILDRSGHLGVVCCPDHHWIVVRGQRCCSGCGLPRHDGLAAG